MHMSVRVCTRGVCVHVRVCEGKEASSSTLVGLDEQKCHFPRNELPQLQIQLRLLPGGSRSGKYQRERSAEAAGKERT